jgi:K+-transporting ATPase ATPase C chain
MRISSLLRLHWAALRALLALTVIVGVGYPLFIWLVAQIPGLKDKSDGSIIELNGRPVASSLIGQLFTDDKGNALPQYFQSRPSAAGAGYDPLSTSASNLGPESIVDVPGDPALPADDNGYQAGLLTLVCSRSKAVGDLEGVDGRRPFCTGEGVGAVLSVIGPRDSRGNVVRPTAIPRHLRRCPGGVRQIRRGLLGRPDRADPWRRAR